MAASDYSFIDIAVLDEVRQRFAAGDALVVLSTDLSEVLFANGPGARLLGRGDVESVIGADPGLGLAARRQIMATTGYPAIGRDRAVGVRLTAGLSSRILMFSASAITLPDGEPAIVLALPEAAELAPAQRAARAIAGFAEAGYHAALIDGSGAKLAADAGFTTLELGEDAIAGLVDAVRDESDRVVKRLVDTADGPAPAGIARLTDDPAVYLLIVVGVEEEARDEAAAPINKPAAPSFVNEQVSLAADAGPSADDAAAAPLAASEAEMPAVSPANDHEEFEDEPDAADARPTPTAAPADARMDNWYFSGGPADHGLVAAPPKVVPSEAATDAADAKTEEPAAAKVDQPVPEVDVAAAAEAGAAAPEAEHPTPLPPLAEQPAPPALAPAAQIEPEAVVEIPTAEAASSEASPAAAEPDRSSAPIRFVWRTDAESRFTALSPEFAAAVGQKAADVIGQPFSKAAARLGIDPGGEIAGLLSRRDTWSGRTVAWPLEGSDLVIPVDLAALPVYGRDRRFEGFRGFGIARMADAFVDPHAVGLSLVAPAAQPVASPVEIEAPAPQSSETVAPDAGHRGGETETTAPIDAGPAPDAPTDTAPQPTGADSPAEPEKSAATQTAPDADPFRGETPALSVAAAPARRHSDKIIRLAEHRPKPPGGLSQGEQNAFREIGDRLKQSAAPEENGAPNGHVAVNENARRRPAAPAGEHSDETPAAEETPAPPTVAAPEPDNAGETWPAANDDAEPFDADAAGETYPDFVAAGDVEAPPPSAIVAFEQADDGAAEPMNSDHDYAPDDAGEPYPSYVDESDFVAAETEVSVEAAETANAETTSASRGPDSEGVAADAAEPALDGRSVDGGSSPASNEAGREAVTEPQADARSDAPAAATAELQTSDTERDAPPESEAETPAVRQADEPVIEQDGTVPEPRGEEQTSDAPLPMRDVAEEAATPPGGPTLPHWRDETAPLDDGDLDDADLAAYGDDDDVSAPSHAARFEPVENPGLIRQVVAKLPVPVLIHAGDVLYHANEEFLALTGYASEQELASHGGIGALFVDDYDAEAQAATRPPLRLRTRGGEEFPVDAHLQSIPWASGKALLLAIRRRRDEDQVANAAPTSVKLVAEDEMEQLRARVEEMRTILDTATDGVVLVNPEGTIRSINRPAEALFGLDSEDVAGRHFATLFAVESQRAAREYLAGLADNGVASVLNDGREVIGREAQGRFIPLFMTMGKLPGDSGYCAVMRDITPWKRAEEELTQARAVAERASTQKTDFLARVSHEIRTPLNAIIGFSELMMDEKFGPIGSDRYRDYLRDINRSGNLVLDLVNDLLDISKIEAGQQEMTYEAVSLNDMLGETVAMMQPQANRERVIIRSSFASRLPEVVADLRSVRQIALNLLSNAIRFTPPGGQVIVSTAYETSGDVVMRVRDTGIGMSSAEIEQALKPFKQINSLKRTRMDGTGLGLPLTKAMVEANRARFAISSTPGEGTLVEVCFPSTRVLAE